VQGAGGAFHPEAQPLDAAAMVGYFDELSPCHPEGNVEAEVWVGLPSRSCSLARSTGSPDP
jgi:hypothetical protein